MRLHLIIHACTTEKLYIENENGMATILAAVCLVGAMNGKDETLRGKFPRPPSGMLRMRIAVVLCGRSRILALFGRMSGL